MDWSHSYWKYAELVNGRLAMIGVIILLSIYVSIIALIIITTTLVTITVPEKKRRNI